jgi:hypothetical protein
MHRRFFRDALTPHPQGPLSCHPPTIIPNTIYTSYTLPESFLIFLPSSRGLSALRFHYPEVRVPIYSAPLVRACNTPSAGRLSSLSLIASLPSHQVANQKEVKVGNRRAGQAPCSAMQRHQYFDSDGKRNAVSAERSHAPDCAAAFPQLHLSPDVRCSIDFIC